MARRRIVFILVGLAVIAGAIPAAGDEIRPENDEFAASTPIYELPFESSIDNSGADLDVGEPMPSCGGTQATVWYVFAPSTDENLVVERSGIFRSTLAIYRGTDLSDLTEISCSGAATTARSEFRALAGDTYFIQLGSTGRRRGSVDLQVIPSVWQERTLTELEQPVTTQGTNAEIVSIHGRPRTSMPSIYDITVTVGGQVTESYGVMTFGLIDREIRTQLFSLPPRSGRLVTTVGYRYDSSQYSCLADEGEGSGCVAASPIKDLTWLTEGDGRRAELIVSIRAEEGGTTLAERTVTLPYAGQAAGLP